MTPCSIKDVTSPFFCPCNRVENESRQKKAAGKGKTVKEEDPYGGSTDENTDAEAEQDHPIPELPSMSLPVLIFVFVSLISPCSGHRNTSLLLRLTENNWTAHTNVKLCTTILLFSLLCSFLFFRALIIAGLFYSTFSSHFLIYFQTSWVESTFSSTANSPTTRGACCCDTSLPLTGETGFEKLPQWL